MYCCCQTPEGVVSPRRAITRAQPRWSPRGETTNILLIKSNSRFESRATTVSVAMSLRSIAFASIPGRENARASFRWRLSVWNRTAPDRRHLLPGRSDNEVDHAVCLKVEFQMHTVVSKKMASPTQLWYIRASAGRFFDGIACLMKVWPLFKREFPRVPIMWRSTRARISNMTSQM